MDKIWKFVLFLFPMACSTSSPMFFHLPSATGAAGENKVLEHMCNGHSIGRLIHISLTELLLKAHFIQATKKQSSRL